MRLTSVAIPASRFSALPSSAPSRPSLLRDSACFTLNRPSLGSFFRFGGVRSGAFDSRWSNKKQHTRGVRVFDALLAEIISNQILSGGMNKGRGDHPFLRHRRTSEASSICQGQSQHTTLKSSYTRPPDCTRDKFYARASGQARKSASREPRRRLRPRHVSPTPKQQRGSPARISRPALETI